MRDSILARGRVSLTLSLPLARRGSGEMADTPVLGTGAPACGFKSRLPHKLFTAIYRNT